MGVRLDLDGRRFGRLLVLRSEVAGQDGHIRWKCACDCGAICVIRGAFLISGHTRSCGCLARESSTRTVAKASAGRWRHRTSKEGA